jgi:hypothetical protein
MVQGVTHLQITRDVGRRDDHAKDPRFLIRVGFGRKEAMPFPEWVPSFLDFFWIVRFRNFHKFTLNQNFR